MTGARPRTAAYLRFLAWTVALAVAIALLGYLPTKRWRGEGAVRAMAAGCGVGVVASALGGVPVLLWSGGTGATGASGVLAAMAVRFAAALALALAGALSGEFERGPFLLWVAISYMALLTVDTRYALGSLGSPKQE
jgi:glycosyltransferase involved in cell wall biosynthesis